MRNQALGATREDGFTPALKAWAVCLGVLAPAAVAGNLLGPVQPISDFFLYRQDLLGLGVCSVLIAVAALTQAQGWLPLPTRLVDSRWSAPASALAVGVVAWAGGRPLGHGYALSMDEFMARFDAEILRTGMLAAPLPNAWLPFAHALQPIFAIEPNPARWVSGYLPVNAAFLALASALGGPMLMNPVWAAVAVLAAYGVAQSLWPGRRALAITAAVMVATSPQVLIAATTSYAMPAHLALNLVWLLLILREDRLGHTLAVLVAFLASGLHQLIFAPLFAAPFILEMWLAWRWRPAVFHTLAYAAIGLFWICFPALRLATFGTTPMVGAVTGGGGTLATARSLLSSFDLGGLWLMAKDLLRFVTWQNVIAVPLALAAVPAAWRAGGYLRALVFGVILTTAAMFVVMPFQGHGWGYRYLHGLIGSVCLLAAWWWDQKLNVGDEATKGRARALVVAAALASAFVLLPLRAWQVHSFVHPYAMAEARVQSEPAQVVLVDDTGVWYGVDLVRNDPFLRNRPIVLYLPKLSEPQVRDLCGRYSVALFDRRDAAAAGVLVNPKAKPRANVAQLRGVLAETGCVHGA